MKKIVIYIICIIMLFFLIPIICTIRFNNTEETISDNYENKTILEKIVDNKDTEKYNYGKYKTIKLLHTDTGKVEKVNFDEYVCHVVSAEMPVSFEKEALKAQAVVARTYTIYTIKSKKHKNADICDDFGCCQAWISKKDRYKYWKSGQDKKWNKIKEAVYDTKGKIITYKGKVINAFFHSNSGGATERPFYVWGGEGYPYLQSVQTAGEDNYDEYSSEVTISKTNFVKKMKSKYKKFNINWKDVTNTFTMPGGFTYTIKRDGLVEGTYDAPKTDSKIVERIIIPAKTTYSYEIIYNFNNLDQNQDEDQGKQFSAKIVAEIVQ